MKRSYTYLKGLLTLALAAFTGWMWAADPVATWTDFNTLTSGTYTITKDAACTVNDDGSITLGGTGLTVSGCPNMGNISVVMDVSTLPASGDYTLVNYPVVTGNNPADVGLMYKGGKLEQEWNNGGNYGNATWTPGTGRYTITFAYGKLDGATTYVGNVAMVSNGTIKTGSTSITSFTIGSYKTGDDLLPATGMTVHSISIYDSKINPLATRLESEQAQIASTAWLASFDGDSSTTGWINSFGGEAFVTYVDTPNGKGGKVASGQHPYEGFQIAKPYTIAYYADISGVAVSGQGAALLALGKGGNNIVLTKTAANKVAILRTGNKMLEIEDADLAKSGSYHLFVFGTDDNGSFLYVDGTKVTGEALPVPVAGFQIGSMFGGIGSYVQAYGTIVDEVRGYNALLDDTALATLKTKFPEYLPPAAEATVEGETSFTELNLAEGDTTNITITLKDGATLEMDKAPTCAMLTIISEGAATVTSSVDAPFANAAGLTLSGDAVTVPAKLPNTVSMNATTITLVGGETAENTIEVTSVINVANGKTLKTKGYVNLSSGSNAIATGGTLEVVSGETTLNAAEQGIKGTLTIDAGATLKNVRESDALAYGTNGVVVNVYGTLDMGETRWTIFANNNTINAYAGATIKGAGQSGAGSLDIWNKANDAVAINVLKNGENAADVTISATIRYRELSVTFDVAEGMTANLTGTNADVNTIEGGLKVKGAGTLKLSGKNAYANGVGVTVESGATLIVAHAEALSTPVTNNGTITYTIDATPTNTLSGEGVTGVNAATLNMLSANLDGYTGTFAVANNGTLILPASKEEGVTVAAGSTLKLNLTDDQLKAPYSTSATIDGGTLVYTKNAGADEVTEGVEGGAYTPATAVVYTVADGAWSITPFANAPIEIDFGETTEESVNLAEILGEVTTIKSLTVKGDNGGALASSGVTIPWTDIQTAVTVDSYTNQFGAITIYPDASLKLVSGQGGNLTYDVTGKIPEADQARPKLIVSGIEGNGWGMNNDGKVISNVDLEVVGEKRFYMRTALIGENVALISNVTGDAYVGMEGTSVTLIGLSGNGNFYAGNHWSGDAGAVTINLPAGAEYTFNGAFNQKTSGSLTVSGAGKLTLAGANTYSGGTTISNGATLVAANAAALGTGAVTNENNCTLELNAADAEATLAQTISGGGAINVKAGTWALTAANGIAGNVTIATGATVDVSAAGAKLYTTGWYVNGPVLTINGTLVTRHWEYGESLGNLKHNAGAVVIDGGKVVFTETMESERVAQIGDNGATFEIAEDVTYTAKAGIAGDGNLTIDGKGTLALTKSDAMGANSSAVVTINADATLKTTTADTSFFRTVLGEGKIVIPENTALAIGEATNYTGETKSGLSNFAGTIEIAGALDPRSWAANRGDYTIGACNIVMQGGEIKKLYGSEPAKVVIASGKTLSGTGTIYVPVTLADGATLAGPVTVNNTVTIDGTVNITHATKADDVVIICNNAADILASLPTAPATLKYEVVDGTTIKLVLATITVTLPDAPDGTYWYYNGAEVTGSIEGVDPNADVILTLKAVEGYVFADGSTEVEVTVSAGETSFQAPDVTAATPVAKVGETKYQTLAAAIAAGAEVTVIADIVTNGPITINKTVKINLGGKTITATNDTVGDGVFHVVADGDLTLTGDGKVNALGQNDYCMAVWADGGKVTIEGGTYTNLGASSEEDGAHFDLIYVKNNGSAIITGGTFICETPRWTLNSHNTKKGTISVTGGKFYGLNPADIDTDDGVTTWCADGYHGVADGEYYVVEQATGKAAKIAGIYYDTLADALEAAQAGQTITLVKDIEVAGTDADRVVINKAITLDGNGKKITANTSLGCRAINVDCAGAVTIKNLTIDAGERAINIINKAAKVTINGVTATADNVAVMIATSAGAATVSIEASNLTGLMVVGVYGAGADVDIAGSTIANVDANKNENYGAITVGDSANGAKVDVTNTTITTMDDSKKAYNFNSTATITGVDQVGVVVAMIGEAGYDTIEEAAKDVKAGQTIVLVTDVTATKALAIAGTLDLNGKTFTGDCLGTVKVNGGMYVTSQGYKMVGPTAEYYQSSDAVFTMVDIQGSITLNAGTLTVVPDVWWTGADQTLTIAQGATFVIPAGKQMNVLCDVIANGTLTIEGKANLYSADATIKAPEGLNVITTVAGCEVAYADGKYTVVKVPPAIAEDENIPAETKEAIKAAMANAGVTEIESYTITTKNTPKTGAEVADVAAVLAVFDVTPTVANNGVLTVAYEFGISAMTNNGDTITITAGVTGAEYRAGVAVVFYADGEVIGTATTTADSSTVSITIIDAEDIDGKKITVKATK